MTCHISDVNINTCDTDGDTPLTLSIKQFHLDLAFILLEEDTLVE